MDMALLQKAQLQLLLLAEAQPSQEVPLPRILQVQRLILQQLQVRVQRLHLLLQKTQLQQE